MIERVIENWLINSTEKVYQVPYCQVLGIKGFSVLQLSSHGISEHGKDIIARDDRGTPCAFQLKTGSINTETWRAIYGEITELIEIPIDYPAIEEQAHRAILVTNGAISADVRTKITALNRGNRKRHLPELEVITGKELLADFIRAQGSFLPEEPQEIRNFLRFYLSEGNENADCENMAIFLEDLLLSNEIQNPNQLRRLICSSLLLVSYAIFPFTKRLNFVATINYLVVLGSYIMALAEKNQLKENFWGPSFQLVEHWIREQLEELKAEVLRKKNFLEGELLGDGGLIYTSRTTIILGWLASYELMMLFANKEYKPDKKILELIRNNFPDREFLWGESATPYFAMQAILSLHSKDKKLGISIIKYLIEIISERNNIRNDNNIGLPDPYYSSDQTLASMFGTTEKLDFNAFIGLSYTIKPLIDLLVIQNERVNLAKLWKLISLLQYGEFYPDVLWKNLIWKSTEGNQIEKAFDSPQSWKHLYTEASEKPKKIPSRLAQKKPFLPLFLLTFPHRFRSDFVKILWA